MRSVGCRAVLRPVAHCARWVLQAKRTYSAGYPDIQKFLRTSIANKERSAREGPRARWAVGCGPRVVTGERWAGGLWNGTVGLNWVPWAAKL